MRLSRSLALVLCLATIPSLAHADDATRRAKAEQLMLLTHSDKAIQDQLAALQDRVNTLAKQQFSVGAISPEQKQLNEEYLKKMSTIVSDEVGWPQLRPLIVQSYATSFTDEEFDAILTFYKSPAGQAIVNKTPELSNKTVSLVQDRIKDMQPKLAQITQDYSAKMKPPAGAAPTLKPRTEAPAK